MDTWALIDSRVKAMQPFYDQVDKTRKRLKLTPFAATDYDGKTTMKDVINVTENKSATYVMKIIASLLASRWQIVVEGGISKRDAHKIEQFIELATQQSDEYLLGEYGLAGIDTWIVNHICHTSLIGAQWMSSIEEGKYQVKCVLPDMRYAPFVQKKWAAPITFRDKEDLQEEIEGYAKEAEEGDSQFSLPTDLKDTDNEVRDYWDKETNELWIEKQLVFRQKNTYGEIPFVFVWATSGFLFRDKGYLEHESPSLLYLNEGLYDQLSRQLSVDATLGFESLLPAYEYPTENPSADKTSRPPPRRGETLEVPEGELHQLVPRGDVNKAQLASRDEVSRMIDEAAPMSPRAYTSPPSAIEVATEVELLSELQNPRVIALKAFKEQLARLAIRQVILLGTGNSASSISGGATGRQGNFSVSDLKDPQRYSISYQFMKQNKRLAIVNEARALAAWGKFPNTYIFRDILSVEDPAGWERALDLQQAKAANPALALAEMAVRYAEEAEDIEDELEKDLKLWQSVMLTQDYVMLMRGRLQPSPANETQNLREATKETGNAQGLIKMLGPGGGRVPLSARPVEV